jgi:hypothetical protein
MPNPTDDIAFIVKDAVLHNGFFPQYGQLTMMVRMGLPHRRQV